MNDKKIMELIRNGRHSTALDMLYEGYRPIRKFIISHGGSDDDARDTFQEALIIFCQKAVHPDFQLSAKVSTYLFSVCKYLWKDKLQKENRYVHHHNFELEADVTDIMEAHHEEEKYKFLDKVLDSIGERCKEILQAYYFSKWSMQTIAEKFGYGSEASAKNQKYKCLERAKELAKKEQLFHNQMEA